MAFGVALSLESIRLYHQFWRVCVLELSQRHCTPPHVGARKYIERSNVVLLQQRFMANKLAHTFLGKNTTYGRRVRRRRTREPPTRCVYAFHPYRTYWAVNEKKGPQLDKHGVYTGRTKLSRPPNYIFVLQLVKTKFTIFTPVSDHGYYEWKPPPVTSPSYCRLSDVHNAESILRHVELDALPPKLVPLSSERLRLPQFFTSLQNTREYANKYPYGQYHVASLYVASQHRGVDLNDIDFVFGGSTLEMLAQCDNSDMYIVTRIPGTKKACLVVKFKEYTQNHGDLGFQFERWSRENPCMSYVLMLHSWSICT
jgi:hypothetical protein